MSDLTKHISIATLRNKSYLSFQSGAVQRWAAKHVRDYYTLTSLLWRKAGLKTVPEGCDNLTPTGKATCYFNNPEDAQTAAETFIEALRAKGVV